MSNLLRNIVLLFCVVAVVAGCVDDSGVVAVEVCGDVLIPNEVTEARVSILNSDREEVRSAVIDLVKCPGPEFGELPQTLEFSSPGGTVWIVAQGLKNEVEILKFERRADLNERDEVLRVGLTRACLGIRCPLGQTCVRGSCEVASFDDDPAVCGTGAGPADDGATTGDDDEPLCPDDGSEVP